MSTFYVIAIVVTMLTGAYVTSLATDEAQRKSPLLTPLVILLGCSLTVIACFFFAVTSGFLEVKE